MNICDDTASLSGIHSVSKNSDHFGVTGRLSISWDLTVFLRCSLIESKHVRRLLSSNQTPTPLSSGSDVPKKVVWCYLVVWVVFIPWRRIWKKGMGWKQLLFSLCVLYSTLFCPPLTPNFCFMCFPCILLLAKALTLHVLKWWHFSKPDDCFQNRPKKRNKTKPKISLMKQLFM